MSSESREPQTPDRALFSPLLETAVRLAARGHHHQFRKNAPTPIEGDHGGILPHRVPYIAHLMGTMCILARVGVRDEVLAAAILHDYLEDVPDPDGQESIRAALGDEVLALVLEVTEHKRRDLDQALTWSVRKQEQIDHLIQMPLDAVLIKAADVLHNLISLNTDLEEAAEPRSVWRSFNAGSDRQLWYFSSVIEAVSDRIGDHRLIGELAAHLELLRSHVEEQKKGR